MKMLKFIKPFSLYLFMATFFLNSCTTTRTAILLNSVNEGLELYTVKLPSRNFEEIGYIQTDGGLMHTQVLLNGLKKKAIELNANAVINIKFDLQGIYPLVSGTAIKYIE